LHYHTGPCRAAAAHRILRAVHAVTHAAQGITPDWDRIDTVCLDMDGTVLDQRFDNLFWLEALPQRWAAARGLPAAEGVAELMRRFAAKRGTLEWYCVDHWSEDLEFDIAALKHELRGEIRYLPGATDFLGRVRARGKRLLLTTNAHPISLAIKNGQTDLARHFDELISSHEFGAPKESQEFWTRLERTHRVAPRSTLFVDDSVPVIAAARAAGVACIYQVLQPDSTQPAHRAVDGFAGVMGLGDLLG
jgi:putative hydrolase of the HAD superfamily